MEDIENYLTPEEAAEILKLHPETVRRMLNDGRLPGAKLGGSWRIRQSDLDAIFNAGKEVK
jgi:excisionase family DNA binding protein